MQIFKGFTCLILLIFISYCQGCKPRHADQAPLQTDSEANKQSKLEFPQDLDPGEPTDRVDNLEGFPFLKIVSFPISTYDQITHSGSGLSIWETSTLWQTDKCEALEDYKQRIGAEVLLRFKADGAAYDEALEALKTDATIQDVIVEALNRVLTQTDKGWLQRRLCNNKFSPSQKVDGVLARKYTFYLFRTLIGMISSSVVKANFDRNNFKFDSTEIKGKKSLQVLSDLVACFDKTDLDPKFYLPHQLNNCLAHFKKSAPVRVGFVGLELNMPRFYSANQKAVTQRAYARCILSNYYNGGSTESPVKGTTETVKNCVVGAITRGLVGID